VPGRCDRGRVPPPALRSWRSQDDPIRLADDERLGCWAWAEGGGECLADFERVEARIAYAGIDPDYEGVGYPGTLVGVVPDDVTAAAVQIRGVSHPAIVQSNGLFYELPDGSCTNWAFEALTAAYRDGTSKTIPIEWHHGSELPETCAG
jgi:hypothetical protein